MIGVDISEIARVRNAIARDSFRNGVFTAKEQAYCDGRQNPAESYAGLFCAKEATAKALKVGFGNGLTFKDIEIVHDEKGAPTIVAHGRAVTLLDGCEIDVSISHDGGMAVAVAEITRRK